MVAYLPLKHNDMSSIPKIHAERLDKLAPNCNPSSGELRQTNPWNFQAWHLRPLCKVQVSGIPFNLTQWVVSEEWYWWLFHTDSYLNTCAYAHTNYKI